jgi:hypothetical protein
MTPMHEIGGSARYLHTRRRPLPLEPIRGSSHVAFDAGSRVEWNADPEQFRGMGVSRLSSRSIR